MKVIDFLKLFLGDFRVVILDRAERELGIYPEGRYCLESRLGFTTTVNNKKLLPEFANLDIDDYSADSLLEMSIEGIQPYDGYLHIRVGYTIPESRCV